MNALTLGLIAALCWGIHDITIRYLSRSVPLMAALLCVLAVGAVFQAGALILVPPKGAFTGLAMFYAVLAGGAFLVAGLGLYFAFERGPVRIVAPVVASYPILSVGFAVAEGASIGLLQWGAVLGIIAGVALVASPAGEDTSDDIPPVGPTLALAAISAVGFACTFKLGQLAAELSGELSSTLMARLVAFVLLLGLIAARRDPIWPGRSAIVPLILMGILDGIALLAVISAATVPHPEYAAVTSSVFGLITIVLAWAFLKERMTALRWSGCLLAFAGIGYLAL